MNWVLISLLLTFHVGHAAGDPILALTEKLNRDSLEQWVNGMYPIIRLSGDASIYDVLADAVQKVGFTDGHIKQHTVLDARTVLLGRPDPREHYAVLIDSDLGKKIVLIRYQGEASGWWTRFYDVEE